MYRAITLKVLRSELELNDEEGIGRLLSSTRIALEQADGKLRVYLDDEDVTDAIRSIEVTEAVSAVSSLRKVRELMVREQRRLGAQKGIVVEGRDIGTIVFPDADLKIYMVANLEGRARRRQAELADKGILKPLHGLAKEIEERDTIDSTREHSPLQRAGDAIELDTTHLTIEQQVEFVVQKVRQIIREQERE
jgi:cytidylate kinase